MGIPAACVGDMTACPLATPGTPPVPHVGGPIIGPGCKSVIICSRPAAVLGDSTFCVGPPNKIVIGSTSVLFEGKPAARVGDTTAHGGKIVGPGAPTVLIGG